jgi:hypothetical protein
MPVTARPQFGFNFISGPGLFKFRLGVVSHLVPFLQVALPDRDGRVPAAAHTN